MGLRVPRLWPWKQSLGRFSGTRTNNPRLRSAAMPPPDEVPTIQLRVLIEGAFDVHKIGVQRGMEVCDIRRELYSMRGGFPSLRNATLETMQLWKVRATSLHKVTTNMALTGRHRS